SRQVSDNGRHARQEAIHILESLTSGNTQTADDLIQLMRLYRGEGDETKYLAASKRLAADFGGQYTVELFLAREAIRNGDDAELTRHYHSLRDLDVDTDDAWVIKKYCFRTVETQNPHQGLAPANMPNEGRGLAGANAIYDFVMTLPAGKAPEEVRNLAQDTFAIFLRHASKNSSALLRFVTLVSRFGNLDAALDLILEKQTDFPAEIIAAANVAALRNGAPTPQQIAAIDRWFMDALRQNAD